MLRPGRGYWAAAACWRRRQRRRGRHRWNSCGTKGRSRSAVCPGARTAPLASSCADNDVPGPAQPEQNYFYNGIGGASRVRIARHRRRLLQDGVLFLVSDRAQRRGSSAARRVVEGSLCPRQGRIGRARGGLCPTASPKAAVDRLLTADGLSGVGRDAGARSSCGVFRDPSSSVGRRPAVIARVIGRPAGRRQQGAGWRAPRANVLLCVLTGNRGEVLFWVCAVSEKLADMLFGSLQTMLEIIYLNRSRISSILAAEKLTSGAASEVALAQYTITDFEPYQHR